MKHLGQLVLLGALVLGSMAFVTSEHVTLVVDGQSASVTTTADTVGQMLSEHGVDITSHDLVSPGIASLLHDGQTVRVDRGRFVVANVDGRVRQDWTTATTVEQALSTLGVQTTGAVVSAPLTAPVPLNGMALTVRLPYRITIVHDLQRTTVLTTARTVDQALRAADVRLGARDQISGRSSPLVDGSVVTITRVGVSTVKLSYAVARPVITRNDPDLYVGSTRVVRAGRDGRGVATYRVVRHDGTVVKRTLLDRAVVRKPQARIVRVGTKPRPYPTVTGVAGLNWAALAQCESSGNPRAVNPAGYYGLYQFSLGTWASVGGSGNPIDATPSEQTYRAQLLYQRSGASPWPVCGPLLYS